jgi:hypothetical protein
MKEPRPSSEIQSATDAVARAEGDLARLLGAIKAASRAEKRTASDALRNAFRTLRAAREQLVRLEKLARA